MDDTIHYLTADSLAELKRELEKIKNISIPEIAKRIDEAKQQGDLSENAEYHQAREDMSWAQGRLLELEHIINNAQIIVNKKTGIVQIGSTLKVKINNEVRSYTIVGPQEVNPTQGLISNESPLGEAFLGHREGDTVHMTTPAGTTLTYEILEIH